MSQSIMRGILAVLLFLFALPIFTEDAPDEASCRSLYKKRIEELSGANDLASFGIADRKKELLSESTVARAVRQCVSSYSAARVACELEGNCGEPSKPDQPEPAKPDQPEEPTKPEPPSPPATADGCMKAYNHMLSVYATDEFKKKPGNDRLLQSWNSEVSRKSFQARCLRVFHKSDVDCIVSSADPDYVRACLLLIPE